MKLIFTKRPKNEEWLPTFSKELLLAWLHVHGIWPEPKTLSIKYNNLYNFYDIIMFPSPGNRKDTHETLARDIDLLAIKEEFNINYMDKYWFRWENNKNIKGVRFWISAEISNRKQ